MKINSDALMSDAEWALYDAEPAPPLPPPTKDHDAPKRPKAEWRRIITVQNPCGCLVIRFESYHGKAIQRACPHTGGW